MGTMPVLPCHQPNAVLFLFTFIIVDLRAVLRMRFCNIRFWGRGGARGAIKTRGAGSHRKVRDYKLNAGDMDCRCGDHRFCPASNAKNSSSPERRSEFLGMAGRKPL